MPTRLVVCIEHKQETVVQLSNGDIISGLRRPLAAEIDKRPLLTSQKTPITSERYTVVSKHVLNTNRKPWSTNRLVHHFRSVASSDISHVTRVNGE
jgi:hypothetical protein